MPDYSLLDNRIKFRSFIEGPSTEDRNSTIDAASIKEELQERGLLDASRQWEIRSLSGGLNSRVFVASPKGGKPLLTIRLRADHARSSAEVDGLSDGAGCPGVPRLRLLTHNMLVHGYVPGAPRDFRNLSDEQLRALGDSLACIHEIAQPAYTPWPNQILRPGNRADLLRFRTDSLKSYDSYADAAGGRIHPELTALMARLSARNVTDPSWSVRTFSRLHGDLSRGNILWLDDVPAFIDWEYSRIGDPAEDLAYLLTEQDVDVDTAVSLQRAYVEADGAPDVMNRLPTYALFTAVDSVLWWADYARTHGADAGPEIERRVAAANRWLPYINAS